MSSRSTLKIFGADFDKSTEEYKHKKVFIVIEGQEDSVRIKAMEWARKHNCTTIIETRRKIAKNDGEIGRSYVKGRGLTTENAVNILRKRPRTGARNGYELSFARIV